MAARSPHNRFYRLWSVQVGKLRLGGLGTAQLHREQVAEQDLGPGTRSDLTPKAEQVMT